MRVLAYRHVPFEGLGYVERALAARGVAFDYADLYDPAAPVRDPQAYDALIVLGGPMSANDDLPFLHREVEVIRDAVQHNCPVLGICLGGQLLARALGATVSRNAAKEIGWFPLEWTEAGRRDPLFAGLKESPEVFHWHSDTFAIPEGATLLASSKLCPNQAFRAGGRCYGLQFHLEVTPAMIADWCVQDENCGDVRELETPIDAERDSERLEALAVEVFQRWVALL